MEKRVKDIMLPVESYPTVQAETMVKEVVSILAGAALRDSSLGLDMAVVMDRNTMIGTIGLNEIIQALDPAVLKAGNYRGWTISADMAPPVFLKGLFTEKCNFLADLPAREIMRPLERKLDAGDTLIKAVHVLLKNGFEPASVWQNDRVVGILGQKNIFNEVVELQLSQVGTGRKKQAAV